MHECGVRRRLAAIITVLFCAVLANAQAAPAQQPAGAIARISVAFPASLHAEPITGRVFVFVSRNEAPEPRLRAGDWMHQEQFLGADVNDWKPGAPASVGPKTLGYPLGSLAQLPPGDYYVQALVNIYTEFHRSDGHTIWAHMDQWEG